MALDGTGAVKASYIRLNGLGHRFGHLDVVRCARRTLIQHSVGRYDLGRAVRTTSTRQGSLRSPIETMTSTD